MKSQVLFIIALFAFGKQGLSQNVIWGKDENQQLKLIVKQLDEFIDRFNFKKSIDGSAVEDTAYVFWDGPNGEVKINRKAALSALVDYYLYTEKPSLVNNFLDAICTNETSKLSFYDQDWYATVNTGVQFKGMSKSMDLTLKVYYDKDLNGAKWVICGLDAPFLLSPVTERNKDHLISPSHNETSFQSLERALEDRRYFGEYLPVGFEENRLTLLYQAVTKDGSIKLSDSDFVGQPVYHFLQIPGWVIQVSYVNREEFNRGWLITDLFQLSEREKGLYRTELLHIQ